MRPLLPDYGTFTHWPEGGRTLIHPEDIAVVTGVIPSSRVFRRYRFDGIFYQFSYGAELTFRLRPCMWLKLNWEGFDVGDKVEVSGLGLVREPFVARIVEMRYSKNKRRIEYALEQAGTLQPRPYYAEQIIQLTEKRQLRPDP